MVSDRVSGTESLLLTSPKNPWIRKLRQLHRSQGRREQGAFLVEGSHLIEEALRVGWPLQALCYTPDWASRHPHLLADLPKGLRRQPVSPEVMAALCTTESPEGAVAVAVSRQIPSPPLSGVRLGLVVETLQDPGNLGSLIRVVAAAGADGLWLSADSVDPENPKVLRASAGQWFRRPPQVVPDLAAWIQSCRCHGIQVLAATLSPTANCYWDQDLTRPTLFLLGNEGAGLREATIQQADAQVRIPMAEGVESLNVAMTGGLLLYEALRQRRSRSGSAP
ncbi:TrmH family RNA methyltransferase [Synechococcus sp. R3-13]|uniref:TrmH family RNA methyltransferase n=1 Tax=Synechococcus sp. R3-13 TaxID=2421316 RepID=UPI0039C2AABF